MKPIAYIDVETTGLHPNEGHEIIEVCILKNNKFLHLKVQPLHIERADPIALRINGYSHLGWQNAVHPQNAAKQIADFLGGCIICAHNPHFDMKHIKWLLDDYDLDCYVDYRYIDTVGLAREHLQGCGLRSLSMDSIRTFLGWSVDSKHTAYNDATDVRKLHKTLVRATVLHRLWWRVQWWIRCKFKTTYRKGV